MNIREIVPGLTIDLDAEWIDLRGRVDIREIPPLPNAEYVDASGCTGLSTLGELPNAKTVDASGCTGLSTLGELPNAEYVYASGCTGLQPWLDEYQRPGGRMEAVLTGGGKTVAEIVAAGAWNCHDWNNCPMHAAYGANGIADVPERVRSEAALFVGLFDARLLRCPAVVAERAE